VGPNNSKGVVDDPYQDWDVTIKQVQKTEIIDVESTLSMFPSDQIRKRETPGRVDICQTETKSPKKPDIM
jgi:hypothetical protein